MSLTIDLTSVAYEQADAEWLSDRKPYQHLHQVHQLICEALERKETLCLFLVTPTGSGKTLASYAHSILTGEPVLGVYPTNELIADQVTCIPADLDRWQGTTAFAGSTAAIDAFLQSHPQGRFVAIFDAVAGAIEIAGLFHERYPEVAVGEVHDLSSQESRDAATLR